MKEAIADLWTYPADVRVITTNATIRYGVVVMGKGCALEAKQRYPGIDLILGHYVLLYGNRPFRLRKDGDVAIVSLPTKRHYREPSDRDLIEEGLNHLVDMADKFGWKRIVMPRPGCGAGGLDWSDVKPMLEDILDDRFTVVHLEGK